MSESNPLYRTTIPPSRIPFLRGYTTEIVINEESLRCGRVDQPEKHRIHLRKTILCVVTDYNEVELCVDSGGWRAPLFGIYRDREHMREVVGAIAEYWPEVKIMGCVEYQGYVGYARKADLAART